MARKLLVHFLVFVCLALALSQDVAHFELRHGNTGVVLNPRMADKTFDIGDIDSAYWHKGVPGNRKFLISSFEGNINQGFGLPTGKYDLDSSYSLVIHNVSYSDGGPYVWQLKPKSSALLKGSVNITIVAPPERVEDAITTPQPDTSQWYIGVIVVVLLVLAVATVVFIIYKKRFGICHGNRNGNRSGNHSALPMYEIDIYPTDKLAEELKDFYKEEMRDTHIHPQDQSRTRTTEDIYIFPDMFKKGQKKELVKSIDDLKKLLVKNHSVAVMGSAGCGKMALIGKIGYDWACNKFTAFKYVVILRKKEIHGSAGVLQAILKLLPADSAITKELLKDWIRENQREMLMIVDGSFLLESPEDLDRPASEDDWSLKDVLSFNALRKCRLLITISSHQLDKLRNYYSRYTVLETTGFSPENIKKYIHRFFEDSNVGKSLVIKVQSSAITESLAKSPIMLQVLCLIWEHDNCLPKQIANVYDRAIDVLAKHISHSSGQSDTNKIDGFKKSIGQVAFGGFGGLDPREVRTDFLPGDFPEESRKFGLSIGVMSQETHTVAENQTCVVRFLHLYQAYFAACFLVHTAGKVSEQLLPKVTPETVRKMEMLIRFCCGMDDKAGSLITDHLRGLKDGLKTPADVVWLQKLIQDPSEY